jgi:hypothetical protein
MKDVIVELIVEPTLNVRCRQYDEEREVDVTLANLQTCVDALAHHESEGKVGALQAIGGLIYILQFAADQD